MEGVGYETRTIHIIIGRGKERSVRGGEETDAAILGQNDPFSLFLISSF